MWSPSSSLLCLCAAAVLAGTATLAQNSAIPSYFHICKRTDPNLNKCIQDSIESLRPQLKSGIPELEVPGLEPLLLSELNITPPQSSRIPRFKAVARNVKANGVSDFKIHKIEVDVENHVYRISLEIPIIMFDGEYEVNINFLALPIKARGPMYGNTTDAYGEAELMGHLETGDDGQRYLKFDKINVDIALSNYHIYLGNLFGNDPVLSQSVNQAINTNSKDFVKVIKPIVDNTVSETLMDIASKITTHFTFDQLFPA